MQVHPKSRSKNDFFTVVKKCSKKFACCMNRIDLNCDMGEGMHNDARLMPFISSTNIACGDHAGDEDTMKRMVELAMQYGVAIGAHPGFSDRDHFGRRELNLNEAEFYYLVIDQIHILKKITDAFQTKIHHVKPHGAMYNMAARNIYLAQAVAKAVKDVDSDFILYGLSGSHLISEAEKLELKNASEVFADRTYQDDGNLTPRSQPNALIEDERKCVSQVLQMIHTQTVTSVNGEEIPIIAQTVCLHGDGEHAVEFAKQIYESLKENHIDIKAI